MKYRMKTPIDEHTPRACRQDDGRVLDRIEHFRPHDTDPPCRCTAEPVPWKPLRWRLLVPVLHLHIELPFISVRTAVMYNDMSGCIREYIAFNVRVWRWRFEFSFYNTMIRILQRRKGK